MEPLEDLFWTLDVHCLDPFFESLLLEKQIGGGVFSVRASVFLTCSGDILVALQHERLFSGLGYLLINIVLCTWLSQEALMTQN